MALNVDWDNIDLGQRPDVVIAGELDVNKGVVGRARRRRGIPRYQAEILPQTKKQYKSRDTRVARWSKLSDKEMRQATPALQCSGCKKSKPSIKFSIRRSSISGFSSLCKKCRSAGIRDNVLRRDYGITLEEYNKLLRGQGGVCAVRGCGSTHLLGLDHDHDTKANRGVLCRCCNAGMGLFNDDPKLLRAAARYIEQHSNTE